MAELKSVILITNVCKYFTLCKSTVHHQFQKTRLYSKLHSIHLKITQVKEQKCNTRTKGDMNEKLT